MQVPPDDLKDRPNLSCICKETVFASQKPKFKGPTGFWVVLVSLQIQTFHITTVNRFFFFEAGFYI